VSSGTDTVLSFFEFSTEEPDNTSIRTDQYTEFIPDYTQYISEDENFTVTSEVHPRTCLKY